MLSLDHARTVLCSARPDAIVYTLEQAEQVFGVQFTASQREQLAVIPFREDVLRATAQTHLLLPCLPLSIMRMFERFGDEFHADARWYLNERRHRFAVTKLPVAWRLLRADAVPNSIEVRGYNGNTPSPSPGECLPPAALVAYAYFLHLGVTHERLFRSLHLRCRNKDDAGLHITIGGSTDGLLDVSCEWYPIHRLGHGAELAPLPASSQDPRVVWNGMVTACAKHDIRSAQECAAVLGQWLRQDGRPPRILDTCGIPVGLERALAIAGVNFVLEMCTERTAPRRRRRGG